MNFRNIFKKQSRSMDLKTIKQPFWSMTVEETLHALEVRPGGLSEEEVKRRFAVFGANEIKDGKEFAKARLFLGQFASPLIFILIIAGTVTAFLKDWLDMAVIFAAVGVNAILGFYQENKAENILELLKSYVKTRARVRRSNYETVIDASLLVPGDMVRVSQGDKIPADGRIIFVNNFEVDESVLTGESVPVDKTADPVEASVSVGDRMSMVFGGTLAVSGFADIVITSTNIGTEFGRITSLLAKKGRSKTPLQLAIMRFSFWTGLILLVLTAVLFGSGIYLGYNPLEMFLIAVAVAVSAVPEGLPIALTVAMAIGVERLARKKGIVRRLLAAETLGSTSMILTDKTGTLTQAKMELAAVIPYGIPSAEKINELLSESLTTVDVVIENPDDEPSEWRMFGNFMELALVKGVSENGVRDLKNIIKNASGGDRLAFSSERKYAVSVHDHNSRKRMVLLGAPEILLRFTHLSDEEKLEVTEEINERAFSGERVLGAISKYVPDDYGNLRAYNYQEFGFDGLISFRDPLRPGVFESMKKIASAGVRTVIVTGDHRGTAEAVGRELGLIDGKGGVLTGDDLNHLSKEELYSRADSVSVYARVTPEQKVAILNMYKEKGYVVAMTGDGINDAPAMDKADIGVALGSGTDVTKSAADLIILDNNYETIVTAIEQGRRILDNIRKVIVYLLSNSFDELFLIGGAILAGLALPISAFQILYVNLFSDSFPAVAFGFEKEIDSLGRRPRKISKNIFDGQMRFFILGIGIATSLLLSVLYRIILNLSFNPDLARTFIFTTFATYTLLVSFSLRSLDASILRYNPFSNLYLTGGVMVGITMTFIAVYAPVMQKIMGTVPLPMPWVVGVVIAGIVNISIVELGKWGYNKINGSGRQ